MLKPKKVTIVDIDDVSREYIISRMPCDIGRKIITQIPASNAPVIGNYPLSEKLAFELLSYTAVELNGQPVQLTTLELIRNHIPDYETQLRLEKEMVVYNSRFLSNATSSGFLSGFIQIMKALSRLMLAHLSEQSSAKEKQPSTN